MKSILQDIVSHTHSLGNLSTLKITGTDKSTIIESVAPDKTIILNAECKTPVAEFKSVFGMSNLDKLALLLKCPEYKEDAKLNVVSDERNGEVIPTGIHFENKDGDFDNDYRFMSTAVINEKVKSATYKGTGWEVEFSPSMTSIEKFKMQSQVNSGEAIFFAKTEGTDLIFSFGDASTNAGKFVFQHNITGKLKYSYAWPIAQVLGILNLDGDVVMKISDQGALRIVVDSGLVTYVYTLPAHTK